MIGTPSDPGIMVRVMNDLFIHSESQGEKISCHVMLFYVMLCYVMFRFIMLCHFSKISVTL